MLKKISQLTGALQEMFMYFCMQCVLIFFFIFMSYTFSAVKRLMKEAAELKDPTDHYHAQPLEVCFSMFARACN